MEIPEKISRAAQRLKDGYRVNRITVRDFLRHFGAERRGATKVEEIKLILDSLNIKTEPDFETAWIDEPIWLRLSGDAKSIGPVSMSPDEGMTGQPQDELEEIFLESTPSAVKLADQQSESAPTSSEPDISSGTTEWDGPDPTFRIGSLPAANKQLITVNQDDDLARAVTLMMGHDFSQLPVMQGEREVKGVITWKSISMRLANGVSCKRVADCFEDPHIVDSNRTLFDAIPIIVQYGYVLVRQRDKKLTGIVTASDLSLQFQALAKPFLLLREIELHVRRLLSGKITQEDIALIRNRGPADVQPRPISKLTFGDYVRLFENPHIWKKLNLTIHGGELTKLLDQIREVRNDVMHFDPDPMT